ncbi:MAG: bifunctional diguanylate cyclase/phosphodiesterase [Pseudomonadota bacterium]
MFTWTTLAAPLVLFVLLAAQKMDLSAPASQVAILGYAGMAASILYLRYFQSLEQATWIFLLSSLVALGGSAALSVDGYMVSLIFLSVTPVKFGLILNWRQCLKFTVVLVAFYSALTGGAMFFGEADFTHAMSLVTFGISAMGAGLATTAYAYRTKRASLHLERKNKEIERLLLQDPLTGVLNRRAFNALKNTEMQRRPIHLLAVIDLDNFKSINDQHGHDVGDEVLTEFAARLTEACGSDGSVYRLGGDEFVVISSAAEPSAEALGIGICESIDAHIVTSAGVIQLDVSVGITKLERSVVDPDQMFREADIATYEAKQASGSTWVVYNSELRPKHERADKLASLLRTAIERASLDIAFQPQYQIESQAIVGFEALARWQTSELGQISPGEFIPIAESSNLIVELDKTVFRNAINLAQDWLMRDQVLSINVSGQTLLSAGFSDFVERQVRASVLGFEQIQIEITETQILTNRDKAIEVCNRLREMGLSIALDDFGTGFSSLSYLSNLPVNLLKIDRSFVQGCDSLSNQKIMRSIAGLARSLGLCVMIEGVERDWQLEIASDLGCNFVQGFYFSRPLSAEKCAHLNGDRRVTQSKSYFSVETPNAQSIG